MTSTNQIKQALIAYLETCGLNESISIKDADARAEIQLPTLAVDIPGVEAHSVELPMVQRAQIEIILRSHVGDDTEDDVLEWSDQIETALHDISALRGVFSDASLNVYEWIYDGAKTDWDEATSEVTFSANILVQRLG